METNNKFIYETQFGTKSGFFNIYQAKSGAIYMMMGNMFTILTSLQIKELKLFVLELKDFNEDDFRKYYKEELL